MARVLYTLLLTLLLPLMPLRLWWRGRRQPEYRRHIAERFGSYPGPEDDRSVIWIHAVSVGETRAAEPLIRLLKMRYAHHRILLTHMTPTGRATESAVLAACERRYLPYDTPWAVHRFLAHYRPAVGLIMETELWPNLISACGSKGIPLMLVNARLSEKSARGYARFAALTREALRKLHSVSAQSDGDAARLNKLGAKDVKVLGNLKFDSEVSPNLVAQGKAWRGAAGRPIVLCASTREGEEALILTAWQASQRQDALLAIVPRHPQRFDEVAAVAAASGFAVTRRSQGAPGPETQVWIGDSMGEMTAYYAAADVALIGGSLLNYGSQNLIEACAVGTPVLIGPSTYNFAEAAANALACGAAESVADTGEFVVKALALLQNKTRLAEMRAAGLEFADQHRGATERTAAVIAAVLQ